MSFRFYPQYDQLDQTSFSKSDLSEGKLSVSGCLLGHASVEW